jgi:hypothetical protein
MPQQAIPAPGSPPYWQPLGAPPGSAASASHNGPAVPGLVWHDQDWQSGEAPDPDEPARQDRPSTSRSGLPTSMPTVLPAGTPTALPWPGLDSRSLASPAVPTAARRPVAAPAPGPYAPYVAHELALVVGATRRIETVVERRVEVELTRRRETIEARVAEQLAGERRRLAAEMVSDEVAQTLMQKMRSIAREEQFRLGRVG